MIWTLTADETDFPIADGHSRIYQVAADLHADMRQSTQVEPPMRAQWPVAYPDRAQRTLSFDLTVTFPPCASYELAAMQALDIPVQCPRGGVLKGLLGSSQRTYAQAWINGISAKNLGVTNQFTFSITAVNPTTATLSPLALMNAQYVANLSAITGLTGGTAADLDSLVTADVLPGFLAFITPSLGGFAQPKHMRLITDPDPGVTAGNDDPSAGTLIVMPLDYDETTNPKIWTEV